MSETNLEHPNHKLFQHLLKKLKAQTSLEGIKEFLEDNPSPPFAYKVTVRCRREGQDYDLDIYVSQSTLQHPKKSLPKFLENGEESYVRGFRTLTTDIQQIVFLADCHRFETNPMPHNSFIMVLGEQSRSGKYG